ncbi:MAG: tRNA (adenosine(37)-N6)-threonylcarbamoyltransferase complex transferase subunit TsaD [Ignavibacteria bacterium]|nr:tRNA (adenosine(37)-N6)-threonylcarbamoyltransferase complex transferase subunit TsaD [Ignavibacteria bacterium]
MTILAIESSCDETAAAVVKNGVVLSNIVSSQTEHSAFGGVIPEIASRAHLRMISTVVDQALSKSQCTLTDIDAIAVTTSPGLAGALLVGANFAKGLAMRLQIPLVPINHIEGHLYSGFLVSEQIEFPFVSLVVSGGHTSLFYVTSFHEYSILGSTRDDAAGEAFDKTSKMLGLGYPGGPIMDKLAKDGHPDRFIFPRGMMQKDSLQFSYSGLKTAVRVFLQNNYPEGNFHDNIHNICASVQEAIVEPLVKKSFNAVKRMKVNTLVVAGGVSANSRLRSELLRFAQKKSVKLYIPDIQYCIDNAAMIGSLAEKKIIEQKTPDHYMSYNITVNSSALRSPKK